MEENQDKEIIKLQVKKLYSALAGCPLDLALTALVHIAVKETQDAGATKEQLLDFYNEVWTNLEKRINDTPR